MIAARTWRFLVVAAGALLIAALVVRYLYLGRTIRSELGDDLIGPLRAAERSGFRFTVSDSPAMFDARRRALRGRMLLLERRGDSIATVASIADDHSAQRSVAVSWTRAPRYVRDGFTKAHTSGTADVGLTGERVLYATEFDASSGRLLVRELDGDELIERMLGPIAVDLVVVTALLLFAFGYLRAVQRAAAARREQEMMALRTDYTAAISHELRTPLTQIKLFANLLRGDALRDAREREHARRIIEREAERLSLLVDNALTHARFSRGARHAASHPRSTNVSEDAAAVIDAFAPLAAEKNATIVSTIPDTLTASIDSHALRQIMLNLVENAVKYGPEGQTVTLTAERSAEFAHVTVSDEGPGIPADDADRIWLPFERGRGAAAAASGSGIGLSVVRDLVQEVGGRVRVARAARGAQFVIELPTPMSPTID